MTMSLSSKTLFRRKTNNKITSVNIRSLFKQIFRNAKIPSDLFLNRLGIRFCKETEKNAAEVVGVAIGVTQLIGNGIDEQIAPFRVEVNS